MKRYATGSDDPALGETCWPMPDGSGPELGTEWMLRYGTPSRSDLLRAAEILAAYRALVADGTTTSQVGYLSALRRIWRRRSK